MLEEHGAHPRLYTAIRFISYVNIQISNNNLGIRIFWGTHFLFEGTTASALHRAYVALFTTPRDACPNTHAAWQQVMHITNEMHVSILMKAKNTNGAAFRINTYIIKMILLSLCSKCPRDKEKHHTRTVHP
jgi:hypothetical protein